MCVFICLFKLDFTEKEESHISQGIWLFSRVCSSMSIQGWFSGKGSFTYVTGIWLLSGVRSPMNIQIWFLGKRKSHIFHRKMASLPCVFAYEYPNVIFWKRKSHTGHRNMASFPCVFVYEYPNLILLNRKIHIFHKYISFSPVCVRLCLSKVDFLEKEVSHMSQEYGFSPVCVRLWISKAKVCGSVLGGVAILFQGPSAGVTDPSASSGYVLGPTSNWSEIGRKYMLRWMLRWESGFQGGCPLRAGRRCAPRTSSPWSFTDWLYFPCLRHIGWHCNNPSTDCSGEVLGRWSVGRSVSNVLAMGSGYADLESHWLAERLSYLGRVLTGDSVWRRKASRTFPRLNSDPKAEGRRRPLGEALFVRECWKALRNLLGSSDLSWPRKELYRELVVGSASDLLCEWHGWTAEEIRSHWNWAPGSSFLNNSEFSLTWRLARNALPLRDLNYKAGLADMPDCSRCSSGLEETAEHSFYYCERVRPFWDHVGEWTARIEPKKLVLLDVGYVVDNVLPPFHGEKRVVFLAILAVARMGIWTTRNKGLYDDANFSHRDLVLYCRHQLRVKIRCDRKRLDRITFSKRWVTAASLVVRKGAMLESSFPPLPAHGVYGTGP